MKIVFTCGGTAGHVNPALALAGLIKERKPDSEILFVGARRGIEKQLIESAGWPFRTVEISSFHRSLAPKEIKHNLISLRNLLRSSGEAKALLKEFPADLDLVGRHGLVEHLLVRIDRHEIHAGHAGADHAVDHVVAASAYADDLDLDNVIGSGYQFNCHNGSS